MSPHERVEGRREVRERRMRRVVRSDMVGRGERMRVQSWSVSMVTYSAISRSMVWMGV
jgi:hypothetical protein